MELKSTSKLKNNGIKILVYGSSGVGKTTLIKTLSGKTLILSTENGLLPLKGTDIPYISVSSLEQLREAYEYVFAHKADYDNIVLDSVSDIAETILVEEKKKVADARLAYTKVSDIMKGCVKSLRDIENLTVIIIAQSDFIQDDNQHMIFAPNMPGGKLANSLPYLFDEVFYLHAVEDKDTHEIVRKLQTQPDGRYTAKDRSGMLSIYEEANLSQIINKIQGEEK